MAAEGEDRYGLDSLTRNDIISLSNRLSNNSYNVVVTNGARAVYGYYSVAGTLGRLREIAITASDPKDREEALAAADELILRAEADDTALAKNIKRASYWAMVYSVTLLVGVLVLVYIAFKLRQAK